MNATEQAVFDYLRKRKLTVLRNGWPDFFVIRGRPGNRLSGFALEVKRRPDRLSEEQTLIREVLGAAGIPYYVTYADDLESVARAPGRALLDQNEKATILARLKDAAQIAQGACVSADVAIKRCKELETELLAMPELVTVESLRTSCPPSKETEHG